MFFDVSHIPFEPVEMFHTQLLQFFCCAENMTYSNENVTCDCCQNSAFSARCKGLALPLLPDTACFPIVRCFLSDAWWLPVRATSASSPDAPAETALQLAWDLSIVFSTVACCHDHRIVPPSRQQRTIPPVRTESVVDWIPTRRQDDRMALQFDTGSYTTSDLLILLKL
jgi:hypothetical protein